MSSAVRAACRDVVAGAEDPRDAQAALLERVVAVYAAVSYDHQAIEVARVGVARLDRQVEDARSRGRLGQATPADVARLEAQRSGTVANLADAQGSLDASLAAYRATVDRDL